MTLILNRRQKSRQDANGDQSLIYYVAYGRHTARANYTSRFGCHVGHIHHSAGERVSGD
jgi:hypothetical protein